MDSGRGLGHPRGRSDGQCLNQGIIGVSVGGQVGACLALVQVLLWVLVSDTKFDLAITISLSLTITLTITLTLTLTLTIPLALTLTLT